MPVVPYDTAGRLTTGAQTSVTPDDYTGRTSARDAFRMGLEGSVIGSFSDWLTDKWDPTGDHQDDPDYDPFAGLAGTRYSAYADSFVSVRNRREAELVRRRIDKELYRREQLEDVDLFSAAGAAELAGGIIGDPTIIVPAGTVAKGVRLGRATLEGVFHGAVSATGAGIVSESILQGTQETRGWDESALNIGIAGLLGGGLGGLGGLAGGVKGNVAGRAISRSSAFETALDTYSSGSLSAAQRGGGTSLRDEGLKSAFGLEKVLAPTTPILRASASPSIVTRQVMQELAEDALVRAKNSAGIANEISVTRRIEMHKAALADGLIGLDSAFADYRVGGELGALASARVGIEDALGRTGGKLTRRQFAEEVGAALIRGDVHEIPEVQKAARHLRATVFDPLRNAAIDQSLLPTGVRSKVAKSYLTRLYDRQKIAARRKAWVDADGNLQDGFEDKINRWLEGRQRSVAEEVDVAESAVRAATSALKKAEAVADSIANDPRFRGDKGAFAKKMDQAKSNLERAMSYREEINGIASASPAELRAIASEVTDRVLTHERQGMSFGVVPIKRGPLKELTLTIPTEQITEFLEMDAERVARSYHRTMSTDLELARAFGRADMEDAFARIRDSYAQLRKDVTDPKKLSALDKRMDADLRDIAAVRDRIRGTYAMPANPDGVLYRAVRTTKTINFLRSLGGMVISSIPDAMRPVFVHGPQRVVRDALLPLIANSKGYRLAAREAKLAGAALEIVLDGRAMQLADLGEDFARHSKFERGVEYAAQRFGLITLMDPWTVFFKQFSGVVSQTRTLEAVASWDAGKITKKEMERLAAMGIDEGMASRIHRQFLRHGEDQGTLKWAATEAWDDIEAVEHYRAALGREIDKIVVTPGQDKPLWMSTPLGQIIGQFQGYSVASMQRVLLAGLQQRDASALGGFIGMSMAGMLVYYINAHIRAGSTGEIKLSDDPRQWILEGLDRGGAMGYAFSIDRTLDTVTGGNASFRSVMGGEQLSRYRTRQGVVGFLGPTVSTGQELAMILSAGASGEMTEDDIHSIRKMIPMNNVFYWRWLFDEAEEGLDDAIN